MGMSAILFNGAEPFEQIVNTPPKEGPVRNVVKNGQVVSEKRTSKITYLSIAQSQGQITPSPFNHTV